jgi:adenine phosphoribosyltransferase
MANATQKEIIIMNIDAIKDTIRDVPDFPKPGIIFKDITPVLDNPELFSATVDMFVERAKENNINKIAAIDARGFLFGGAVADRLGIGLIPVRKKGKLPYKTYEETYDLEYGTATLTIHQDAFKAGDRVMLLDDLLATGGTALASAHLIEKGGGEVIEIAFLVELAFLDGRKALENYQVYAPVVF